MNRPILKSCWQVFDTNCLIEKINSFLIVCEISLKSFLCQYSQWISWALFCTMRGITTAILDRLCFLSCKDLRIVWWPLLDCMCSLSKWSDPVGWKIVNHLSCVLSCLSTTAFWSDSMLPPFFCPCGWPTFCTDLGTVRLSTRMSAVFESTWSSTLVGYISFPNFSTGWIRFSLYCARNPIKPLSCTSSTMPSCLSLVSWVFV